MFLQLYLGLIWGKENNTTIILISLFINSIQKKKNQELTKNKLNAIRKPTKYKYISQIHRQQKPVQIASWNLTV